AGGLVDELRSLGGEVVTSHEVTDVNALHTRAALLDLTPRQVLRVTGDRLPPGYRRALQRYRYGAGTFKLDWALDGPIPWRDPRVLEASTVHIGGTLDEIAAAEAAVWRGEAPGRPVVLVGPTSQLDPSPAPGGQHPGPAHS